MLHFTDHCQTIIDGSCTSHKRKSRRNDDAIARWRHCEDSGLSVEEKHHVNFLSRHLMLQLPPRWAKSTCPQAPKPPHVEKVGGELSWFFRIHLQLPLATYNLSSSMSHRNSVIIATTLFRDQVLPVGCLPGKTSRQSVMCSHMDRKHRRAAAFLRYPLIAPEFGFTFYLRAVQPELPRYPNSEYTPPVPIRRDHGRAGLPNPVLQTPFPEASSLPSDEVELGFKTLKVQSQQTTAPVINFQRLLELMALII
jgi:hypothetical protein